MIIKEGELNWNLKLILEGFQGVRLNNGIVNFQKPRRDKLSHLSFEKNR